MENATNALMIAAGVLIGVLIISLGVTLFMTLGGFSADTQKEIDERAIWQFNEEFLKYDGRTDLTIQDVITARNKALEINQSYENYNVSRTKATESSYYVDVFFKDESLTTTIFNKDLKYLLDEYIERKDIKCTVTISPVTARVYKLVFE